MCWDHSRDQRLGRDLLATQHRLAELPLLSDDGLAGIIDSYPREAMQVTTMGANPAHPSELRTGTLAEQNARQFERGGGDLIDIIRRGRLRLRLMDVVKHHSELGRIVQRLAGEMMECQPGLRTTAHQGELEISSPSALTYFGFDVEPQVLWQIRGSRQIWVYPRREPFLQARLIRQYVAAACEQPIYFEPAFDQQSRRLPQVSGDVLAFPQHTPYRTINDPQLSVVLRTSYETRESRVQNQVYAANELLERILPFAIWSDAPTGIGTLFRQLVLRARRWSAADARRVQPEPTFRVDPEFPNCVGPLQKADQSVHQPITTFPGVGGEATAAHAVSEI
jgi:hypothetical protein